MIRSCRRTRTPQGLANHWNVSGLSADTEPLRRCPPALSRRARHHLRSLGTLLNNPGEVPAVVVAGVAEQLGLEPRAFAGYGTAVIRWDHQEQQIRESAGTPRSSSSSSWTSGSLARRLYQRARNGNERPTLLFDLAEQL
ncbi:DUF4158 domain-containing protein [Streptomyces sp. NPDC004232]|uniref:DUF4158 domain-containing protein n=1 Tax=unclassified Streptomyces TaxID=2593676 RepID=UPI0033AC801E